MTTSPSQSIHKFFYKDQDDTLYQFLLKMLHVSKLYQEDPNNKIYNNNLNYKENCIIKISGLRQIGYSTCISRLIDEPKFNGKQILVLSPNEQMKNQLMKKNPSFKMYDCETFNSYKRNCCGKRYNLIVVDCASLMKDQKEFEEYVVDLFDKSQPFYLVMLG